MIYINLLPVKDIKRRNKARKEFFFLASFVAIIFLALAAYSAYLFYEKQTQEKSNSALVAQLNKKQAIVKSVEKINEEIKEQERRIEVIRKLRNSSERTVKVFVELANHIPTNRVWLTKLKQSQKDNTLLIRGIALDNSTVALYLEDLKKIADVTDAVLVQSLSEKYNERSIVNFEIKCKLKDLSI